MDLESIYNI